MNMDFKQNLKVSNNNTSTTPTTTPCFENFKTYQVLRYETSQQQQRHAHTRETFNLIHRHNVSMEGCCADGVTNFAHMTILVHVSVQQFLSLSMLLLHYLKFFNSLILSFDLNFSLFFYFDVITTLPCSEFLPLSLIIAPTQMLLLF